MFCRSGLTPGRSRFGNLSITGSTPCRSQPSGDTGAGDLYVDTKFFVAFPSTGLNGGFMVAVRCFRHQERVRISSAGRLMKTFCRPSALDSSGIPASARALSQFEAVCRLASPRASMSLIRT